MRLHHDGAISSVGRASPLHGGGRRFEPVIAHHFSAVSDLRCGVPRSGRLAQLVEHLLYTEGVGGSNPSSPTTLFKSERVVIVRRIEDWAISSVGRASPLHGGGRRFEPVIAHHFCGPLAQLVEQLTFNQLVAGSNPARPTNSEKSAFWRFFRM